MRLISLILTYVFHPSLIITHCLCIYLAIFPEAFGVDRFFLKTPFLFSTIFMTFLLPGLAVFLMRRLKLVGSMTLLTAKERIGPYIAGMVFYLWYYITIRANFEIPALFKVLVLGSVITLAILFFINNFSKVSAHMAGMAGITFFCLLFIFPQYSSIIDYLDFPLLFRQRPQLLPAFMAICSGLVGSARLHLGVHTLQQVFGGFLAGLLAQLISLNIHF